MVISFLPSCRVRILYGYFDGNRLKVAYTKALNFNTDKYCSRMQVLMQWAWPQVNFDTTKPIPLPTIDEEHAFEDTLSTGESKVNDESDDEWETADEDEDGSGNEIEASSDSESEGSRRPRRRQRIFGIGGRSKSCHSIFSKSAYHRLLDAIV